ncbi:ribonuclease H-like domain-containing protein [Tanacetum coccineum]|uniref:Ribonuclease H-like domain-containing protein n=1 Tax=Tanacetum coccineum TaxID=301880 RepID=A0ABQ5FV60_9ASTR
MGYWGILSSARNTRSTSCVFLGYGFYFEGSVGLTYQPTKSNLPDMSSYDEGPIPFWRHGMSCTNSSPILRAHLHALHEPNWHKAIVDEYNALFLTEHRPFEQVFIKARLVAISWSQSTEGIDCDETFSPVVKPATIRTVLSLARSLYGLKQAPRHGFSGLLASTRVGFQLDKKSIRHYCYHMGSDVAYLNLYVETSLLTASGNFERLTSTPAAHMSCNPCMAPLVDTESKLGSDGDLVSDPTLYRSLAGALQYLTFTRPDILIG